MIICHTHKFIYIKTRKTASTSVEIALSKFCGPDDVITKFSKIDEEARTVLGYPGPQNFTVKNDKNEDIELFHHMPAKAAKRFLGKEIWQSYFKFTFERNPFDRAISRYFWAYRHLDKKPDLHEFLAAAKKWQLSCWELYTINDKISVDHVGKYENMAAELEWISNQIGLPEKIVLPEYRAKSAFRADKRNYRELLSGEDRTLIERTCANELSAFGYCW